MDRKFSTVVPKPLPKRENPNTGLFDQKIISEKKMTRTTEKKVDRLWRVMLQLIPALAIEANRKEANAIHSQLIQLGVEWWELEAGFEKYKTKYVKTKLGWPPSIRAMIKYWHDCKPTPRDCLDCLYQGWTHPQALFVRKHGPVGFFVFLNIEGIHKRLPEALMDPARHIYGHWVTQNPVESNMIPKLIIAIDGPASTPSWGKQK